ncbi:cytochrome P450 [Nocardia blacklockiae]|uniref:cytochrome P450 n=1 Tax=Nocardia blacklockiae TaxID=480036 RepID=UPI001893105E|nr:cytochrome P450 [Nocardia blacklockiae]MBF6169853.1 cytochrome P450 [Nocardia blacklockiae]
MSFRDRDALYARLHERPERSYRHASGLRMVWRYDDARELLEATEPGISNANSLQPLVGYRRIAADPRAVVQLCRHLIPLPAKATADCTDDVLHKRVWDSMAGSTGHFTITPGLRSRRTAELTAHAQAVLDEWEPGRGVAADATALSIAYAARVVGSAVGLPAAEWPSVAQWSGAQSGLLGRALRGRELVDAVGALGRLFTVSGRTVAAARRQRTAGFAGRLADAGIPHRVAVSAMANSLAAGVHTVSGTIQQGLQRLLSDPDRAWWELLAGPDAGRVAAKVLALDPGLVAWKRAVLRPVTLRSGTTLPAGPVLVMFAAANRDPLAFDDPLDLRAPGKLPLTFGFGRHVCPGKSLAQLAIEVFLTELRLRAPECRLDQDVRTPRDRPDDLLFSGADINLIG